MKRKIAAILAADVAGYSRLVAEDEEEAIRRLAAYRGVFDDFIANHGGRIFNTAGDAVLAEFASSVEAVRCAVEVQESLRTRNLAFPPGRQMAFRVGVTIADVVERDGDLLGDGVNIAARLQGLAEPGGICVSRAVYEQVANKLTVAFLDIGQQSVKNIPEPVHAFVIAASPEAAMAAAKRRPSGSAGKAWSLLRPAVALSAIAAVAATGALAWVVLHPVPPQPPATPAEPKRVAAVPAPQPSPGPEARTETKEKEPTTTARTTPPAGDPVPKAPAASPPASAPATPTPAAVGPAVTPPSPETRSAEPAAGGLIRDPAIERPFDIRALPIVPLDLHASVRSAFSAASGRKALAVAANGRFVVGTSATSVDDAARQALEDCARQHRTCKVVAVDDVFVVPIPRTVFVRGLFDPATAEQIPASERPELARRLEAASGWSAVAIGTAGHPGVGQGAVSEADAIRGAIADCSTRDRNCRVIALGPFRVERF